MCIDAQKVGVAVVDFRRFPSPDDLLILLTVARLGRFNAVADTLGTTHTTVSRRIDALDKQLGGRTLARTPQGWELTDLGKRAIAAAEVIEDSLGDLTIGMSRNADSLSGLVRVSTSDGFGAEIVTPALVKLQQQHPELNVEMLSETKRISQNRSGVDLEVVAGNSEASSNARPILLTDYYLRLYATSDYLAARGTPATTDEIKHHNFVSYVESALRVKELGHAASRLPAPASSFQSTNIFAQIEAVRAHAGIGLLPTFMVRSMPDLVPVLPEQFARKVPFWAVARPEALRSPAVRAVIQALRSEVALRHDDFFA
ncbi:LysR family transcriptional regulator [Arthrobacter pigmenti]